MIQAYPAHPSVRRGERLRLHVSTTAPAFRVEFYRQGALLAWQASSDCRPGRYRPPGAFDRSWNWPAEDFAVPESWPTGVYLALLVEVDENGVDLTRPAVTFDGRDSRALFVILRAISDARSPILYKLAWATYHAYNASGGGSLYNGLGWLPTRERSTVTTMRPGGGTGGALSFPNDVDVYDPTSPREGFAHWDAPMITWLEQSGHSVDYCTDLDIQFDPAFVEPYRLLLSVGHDEYWSAEVRHAFERFANRGGNIAFFGGNTCWWRVVFDEDGQSMRCLHPPASSEHSDQWWRIEPENALTGVSYRNGGGWWRGEREPLGFTVQHAGHWIYNGTDLRDGDTFGAADRLIGYECDGAAVVRSPDGLILPDCSDGTPRDFVVLGDAQLGPGWQDRPRGTEASATMGLHTPGGIVFTCGTTDWSRLLATGNAVVETITANILRNLTAATLRITGPVEVNDSSGGTVNGVAFAGAAARFHVAGGEELGITNYRWTCAVGGSSADTLDAHGDSATVVMPQDARLVTIAVTGEGGRAPSFGSKTLRVLSEREAAQALLLSELRTLVMTAVPALSATKTVQAGNRPFGDPSWDAVHDGLRAMMGGATAEAVRASVMRLLAIVKRLGD